MKIFAVEPFKNSKSQRKEYVENELKDLAYFYRDPQTKVKNINLGIVDIFWCLANSVHATFYLYV